mmetsp:Transcript_34470/g.107311  ORF Transcript_34470/g.107311 Transcript_34470/m.107311 type:complete len:234 (-) Transcript_34470:907-1608(-)
MRELPAEGWRQLGLHLLLVGLVVPLRHPQQKQVLPDAPAQASRQAPPAQVAGQHLPLLVHHLLVSAKHAEELCQSSHQRREHEGGHQQQRQHEASLRPSRGRDVAVADRGHRRQREVEGVDVPLGPVCVCGNVLVKPAALANRGLADGVPSARRPVRHAEELDEDLREAKGEAHCGTGLHPGVEVVRELAGLEQGGQAQEARQAQTPGQYQRVAGRQCAGDYVPGHRGQRVGE